MSKRKWFQVGIVVVILMLIIGLFQFFSEYAALNEEIRLRTAYYIRTGQVLNVVQREYLQGDRIESSNQEVAEITSNGGILAKKPGSSTITITTDVTKKEEPDISDINTDGDVKPEERYDDTGDKPKDPLVEGDSQAAVANGEEAPEDIETSVSFEIIVEQPVQGVTLNASQLLLLEGETFQLEPSFLPSNAHNQNVSYRVEDPSIVEVNSDGLLRAKEGGITTVDVITQEGGFSSSCQVTVASKDQENELYVLEDEIELFTGEQSMVHATTTFDTSLNKEIKYQSSDPSIFTVDKNGKITGKVHGTAELTITFRRTSEVLSVTVKEKKVESIQLSPKSITLKKGESIALETIVTPDDALNKTVNYIVKDKSIVQVSDKGVVKAKDVGITTITAQADSGVTDTCQVEVIENSSEGDTNTGTTTPPLIEVENVALSITDSSGSTIGQNSIIASQPYRAVTKVTPSNATNPTVTFSSSDPAVISIDQSGLIIGKKQGKATITVMASNGVKNSINLDVIQPAISISDILVSPTDIVGTIGDVVPLTTTFLPENATDKSLFYNSNNSEVASVNDSGIVTLRKSGTAVITVKTKNGLEKKINVTVRVLPTISLSATDIKISRGKTKKISAKNIPDEFKDKPVVFSSSNPSVATIDQDGNIKALSVGTTTIKVTLQSDPIVEASTTVTVKAVEASRLKVQNGDRDLDLADHLYVTKGSKINLTFLAGPDNTTDKISYKVSDNSVATFTKKNSSDIKVDGIVTGKSLGETTLVVKAGKITKNITITVQPNGEHVYFLSATGASSKGWYGSDAAVFESNGKFGMIDTSQPIGGKCSNITSLLQGLGVKKLDFIIISHYHYDHYGCFKSIIKNYKVDTVYWKNYYGSNPTMLERINGSSTVQGWKEIMKEKKIASKAPKEFKLGNFKFTPYNTENRFGSSTAKAYCKRNECDENVQTVTYLVTAHKKKLYMAGDIEPSSADKSLRNLPVTIGKKVGKVDIYKAAHHGYMSQNYKEVLDTLSPKHTVVTNNSKTFYSGPTTSNGKANYAGINNIKAKVGKNLYYTYGNYVNLTITSNGGINFTKTRHAVDS